MEHNSSFFLAVCTPKDRETPDVDDFFLGSAGKMPDVSVQTKSFFVRIAYSPSAQFAGNDEQGVFLLLHGEVYDFGREQAESLLREYLKGGYRFSEDINGSFALLIMDIEKDVVCLVTDRLNSRKVFTCEYHGGYWFSSSIYCLPTFGRGLDVPGFTSYLVNGAIYNNRTMLEGIGILDRASNHILTEDGFRTTRYWDFRYNNAYSGRDEKSLREELYELLVQSVQRRLYDNPEVNISLSGGYDSGGLLGIFSRLMDRSKISSFSYSLGEPSERSDAYVAGGRANRLGITHRLVNSYNGDFVSVLTDNAEMGQGIANFCDESDAWRDMERSLPNRNRSVLFVADTCFGLGNLLLSHFSGLTPLKRFFDRNTYDLMYSSYHEEYLNILGRCPSFQNHRDVLDFLYVDQELVNHYLSWREYFLGRYFTVRNPFLDNSILDFMMKVPVNLRRDKRLYRRMITEKFPHLFSIKSAHSSGHIPDWRAELDKQRRNIEALLLDRSSVLDELMPPDAILGLAGVEGIRAFRRGSTREILKKIARRLLRSSPPADKWFYRLPNCLVRTGDRISLVKRLIVARLFLSAASSGRVNNRNNDHTGSLI